MTIRKQSILIITAVIVAVALALVSKTDTVGSAYVDSAFKRALVSFALARGLNGVISVAQGTEIAIQPAGVGINFAPGEILDPVNDLVERFSWIMLLASSSLGVQRVLLSMSAWQGLLVAVMLVALLLIGAHLFLKPGRWKGRMHSVLGRLFILLLILRFMMPGIAIANHWVYTTFLQQDYIQASAELEVAKNEIGAINEEIVAERDTEPDGLIDKAKGWYQQIRSGIDIEERLAQYGKAAERISENSIRLIVVFLMQTLVFPLIFLALVIWWGRTIVGR
ncbi:MAG: hypothetical protein V3U65_02225 [Granulosicoccaceae bacterium]